jgi:hypothetical protein
MRRINIYNLMYCMLLQRQILIFFFYLMLERLQNDVGRYTEYYEVFCELPQSIQKIPGHTLEHGMATTSFPILYSLLSKHSTLYFVNTVS